MNRNKKRVEPAAIGICGFIGLILTGIITMICSGADIEGSTIFKICFVILAISCILILIGIIGAVIENQNDKDAHAENINLFQQEYDEYAKKLGIVKSNTQVTLFDTDTEYDLEEDIPHYLWVANDNINLFPMAEYYKRNETSSTSKPDVSNLHLKSIPIDSVLYFEEIGELRKYTTVSGGGTSLKGALIGYAIAEDVGAIIGSREPIKTKVVSEDDRRIELIYKNQEDQIENLEFKHDAYDVFKKLVPLKEFRKIVSLKTVQEVKRDEDAEVQEPQTVKDKLKQLKDLQAEGLITEDEFLEQKKKILNTI